MGERFLLEGFSACQLFIELVELVVDDLSGLPVGVGAGCPGAAGVSGCVEPGDTVSGFDLPAALVDEVVVA